MLLKMDTCYEALLFKRIFILRFYLGYSMSFDPSLLSDAGRKEVVYFLCCGLQEFLNHLMNESLLPKGIYATNLYFLPNIAFLQAFVNIANIAREYKIESFRFISSEDSYH
jgi:hypothetical protein